MNSHSWIPSTLIDIGMYAEKNQLTETHERINSLLVQLSLSSEVAEHTAYDPDKIHILNVNPYQ